MCTISLTLAKPGEAIPGGRTAARARYGASPACVPGERPGWAVRGRKTTRDNVDGALIRLLTSTKTVARAAARRVRLSGADPSVSRVHAGIVSSTTWATIQDLGQRVASIRDAPPRGPRPDPPRRTRCHLPDTSVGAKPRSPRLPSALNNYYFLAQQLNSRTSSQRRLHDHSRLTRPVMRGSR